MRATGIDIIGDVPWGTHFCQFYENEKDLVDILVPYFKAGLENNEFCMWIASEPLRVEKAQSALASSVGDLERYIRAGQIEFLDYTEWYTPGGAFDAHRVLAGWVDKVRGALSRGFDGLRLTGNTFWLERSVWKDFTEYEAMINTVIGQYPMLAVCTYSLRKCGAPEIMEVMSNHAFALVRRGDQWQVIESTERKEIEASLRRSERRYKSLFNGMSEGFALYEIVRGANSEPVDCRYLDINPSFERLTGLSRDQVIGKLASEVQPSDCAAWTRVHGHFALPGERSIFQHYSPSLDRYFEGYGYSPAENQLAIVFLDTTERRRAEQEMAAANRLKDEFLGTLSHELRTPLNAIIGWSDMLLKDLLDEETKRKALESISRNARVQAQLVADVLDVSRIVSGKLTLDFRSVDLTAVLHSAVDVVRPAASAKGIRLETFVAETPARISGDAGRLQQILWNLLSNAVKFTPPRGRVLIRLERVDSQYQIVVSDSGVGIDPEFLPYVFDRFRQADSSASRQQGGLGLGLAIARHLVELHGGTVMAESPGRNLGATFTVRLPVRAVFTAEEEPSRLDDRPGLHHMHPRPVPLGLLDGMSVVVVDDEADARALIEAVLTRHGARVTTAASAAEAFGLLRAQPPDVLIADIGMPDEDGYRLIERVRALAGEAVANVPAIALTAYGREQDRLRALAAGFNEHISKPVLPDVLVALVARAGGTGGWGRGRLPF